MANEEERTDTHYITAFQNGGRMTLDPLSVRKLDVEARHVESILPCGLRVSWLDGEHILNDGSTVSYQIDAGAGVGSGWLTLMVTVSRDGKVLARQEECIDMPAVARAWIAAVMEDLAPQLAVEERT